MLTYLVTCRGDIATSAEDHGLSAEVHPGYTTVTIPANDRQEARWFAWRQGWEIAYIRICKKDLEGGNYARISQS